MALRDTTWCFDTATKTAKDSHAVLVLNDPDPGESLYLSTGAQISRTHNIVTKEWVCLARAAAQRLVDCKAVASNADSNTRYRMRLSDRVIDAWVVSKEVDSVSAWA
jgi:hypothetical protein